MKAATKLHLSEPLVKRIRAHSAETYPQECCGALLGRDAGAWREVLDVLPLPNGREDSPRNRFRISPEDFRNAETAARAQGLDVVGWYHSHPDHPALPSEYDRENAWPWYSYVIASVEKGEPKQVLSWRLEEDRQRFHPEAIETAAKAEARSPGFKSLSAEGERTCQ